MELPPGKMLLLFDGYCNLCNRTVRFLLQFDNKKKFFFSPLSSQTGIYWREKLLIPENLDSIILIDGKSWYVKSDAALIIAKKLGGIFVIGRVFVLLPKTIRDRLYDWIAKNRYRWFGKSESCTLPDSNHQNRFI